MNQNKRASPPFQAPLSSYVKAAKNPQDFLKRKTEEEELFKEMVGKSRNEFYAERAHPKNQAAPLNIIGSAQRYTEPSQAQRQPSYVQPQTPLRYEWEPSAAPLTEEEDWWVGITGRPVAELYESKRKNAPIHYIEDVKSFSTPTEPYGLQKGQPDDTLKSKSKSAASYPFLIESEAHRKAALAEEERIAKLSPAYGTASWFKQFDYGKTPQQILDNERASAEQTLKNQQDEQDYADYLKAFGYGESAGLYNIESESGGLYYRGKYQFGDAAMEDLGYQDNQGNWTEKAHQAGIYNWDDFLNNPDFQEYLKLEYDQKNWGYMVKSGVEDYIGKTVDGVYITKSGLLAAAGLGNDKVMSGLRSGNLFKGKSTDGNGKPIGDYMTDFQHYNVDYVTG